MALGESDSVKSTNSPVERREVLFTTRDRKFTLHAYPSIIPPLGRLLDMLHIPVFSVTKWNEDTLEPNKENGN